MGSTQSSKCKMQGCTEDGTLQHELLECSHNDEVGNKLIDWLQQHVPGLQPEDVLRLAHGDITEELSLPVSLLTAITLRHIWRERGAGTQIRAYKVRADLEQYITLLRTTRLASTAAKLAEITSLMFQ